METGKVLLILLSISAFFNLIAVILYVRLLKRMKDVRTFRVDTLNTIFYKDKINRK